jgi:two-component system copper resistance phosphate regulon response regulator CusR
MRILIVEDSAPLAELLRSGLRKLGHAVDAVHDGKAGLSYARLNPFDLLVLDIMLPGRDGLSVLAELRRIGKALPVLILSARDAVDDRVLGLRAGADDYLVKPFAFEELVARIEALGRRVRVTAEGATSPGALRIGDLEIDTRARQVSRAGQRLDLRRREYMLLTYLAARKGETVTPIEIEDQLYAEPELPASNVVASAICALRDKLERGGLPRLIHTRRGLGYVFDEHPP